MTGAKTMTVVLVLPTRELFHGSAIRLTARAEDGAFGVLPGRADFVTALAPGIVSLIEPDGSERLFGTDEGIFVKQGARVEICVRRAIEGSDLLSLKDGIRTAFSELDERERRARTALAGLESDILHRFAEMKGAS